MYVREKRSRESGTSRASCLRGREEGVSDRLRMGCDGERRHRVTRPWTVVEFELFVSHMGN